MNYFPVELHCHTNHSDGNMSPKVLIENAIKRELSGIAITDHNTISGWKELSGINTDICIIKGIELTTFYGHILVLGCERFVDWRDITIDNIDFKTSILKYYNGIIGLAHPFRIGSPIGTGCHWDYNINNWNNIDYIEVISGSFPIDKYYNIEALNLWTKVLDMGYKISPTSGMDWHRPSFIF